MMRLASNAAAGRKVAAAAAAGGVQTRAASTAAAASATPAKPLAPRKRFDPKLIYPSKAGHVRICSNTTRDAQQSNLSAEMAHAHRVRIARLVDDCYKDIEGPPGVEQIWGGTVPMVRGKTMRTSSGERVAGTWLIAPRFVPALCLSIAPHS